MPRLISKQLAGGNSPTDLAQAICDALAPKLQAITNAVETITWDGDMVPAGLCTPDGRTVFICKLTNVETGVPTFELHVVDEATGDLTPYAGPTQRPDLKLQSTPFDVNTLADVTGNVLDGTAVIPNACDLIVKPIPDCPDPAPVTVTWTTSAGAVHTDVLAEGCSREYDCLESDVTVTGNAVLFATQVIP